MQNQQAAQEWLLAVAQIGFILFLLVAIVLVAVLVIRTGVGSRSISQGELSWVYFGRLFVVFFGIVGVFIWFVIILLFLDRFTDITQALGVLTALFGAIVGLVGTYFGVKTSSDAREGAQQLAVASGGDTTKPRVLSNTPLDREVNVPADIHPTATFSKDMDSSTINPSTFKLLDQATLQQVPPSVPEGVHCDEPTKVATFTPAADLQNGRTYEATITSGVKDKASNTLAQDHVWHFTVS